MRGLFLSLERTSSRSECEDPVDSHRSRPLVLVLVEAFDKVSQGEDLWDDTGTHHVSVGTVVPRKTRDGDGPGGCLSLGDVQFALHRVLEYVKKESI